MNNIRRKKLKAVIAQLEICSSALEVIAREEEDYFDNMPEGIQESQRGDDAEENVSDLESAIESINEAIDQIGSAISR